MNFPAIAYVDIASNLIPFGIGISRIRNIQRERWVFFVFILVAMVTEVVTFWMATQHIHNLWVLQCYNVVEYGSLIILFAAWQHKIVIRKLEYWSIAVFLAMWTLFKIGGIEKFSDPAEYTHTVSSLFLVVAALVALSDLMKDNELVIFRDARFWISSSVLIYFAGNIVLFLYSAGITALRLPALEPFGTLHWAIDIGCNTMYAIAFLCFRRIQ